MAFGLNFERYKRATDELEARFSLKAVSRKPDSLELGNKVVDFLGLDGRYSALAVLSMPSVVRHDLSISIQQDNGVKRIKTVLELAMFLLLKDMVNLEKGEGLDISRSLEVREALLTQNHGLDHERLAREYAKLRRALRVPSSVPISMANDTRNAVMPLLEAVPVDIYTLLLIACKNQLQRISVAIERIIPKSSISIAQYAEWEIRNNIGRQALSSEELAVLRILDSPVPTQTEVKSFLEPGLPVPYLSV